MSCWTSHLCPQCSMLCSCPICQLQAAHWQFIPLFLSNVDLFLIFYYYNCTTVRHSRFCCMLFLHQINRCEVQSSMWSFHWGKTSRIHLWSAPVRLCCSCLQFWSPLTGRRDKWCDESTWQNVGGELYHPWTVLLLFFLLPPSSKVATTGELIWRFGNCLTPTAYRSTAAHTYGEKGWHLWQLRGADAQGPRVRQMTVVVGVGASRLSPAFF